MTVGREFATIKGSIYVVDAEDFLRVARQSLVHHHGELLISSPDQAPKNRACVKAFRMCSRKREPQQGGCSQTSAARFNWRASLTKSETIPFRRPLVLFLVLVIVIVIVIVIVPVLVFEGAEERPLEFMLASFLKLCLFPHNLVSRAQ